MYEYKVVRVGPSANIADLTDQLQKKVDELLEHGYLPQGGPQFIKHRLMADTIESIHHTHTIQYMAIQAMVRD